MRVRHRIPSIFNLSMVDVLCCALGCVILLWLINLRDAKENQDAAAQKQGEADRQLADAKVQNRKAGERVAELQRAVAERDAELRDLNDRLQAGAGRLTSVLADLDASRIDAASWKGKADDLDRKLTAAGGQIKDLQTSADGLGADLKKARAQASAAQDRVSALEREASDRRKELEELGAKYQLTLKAKDSASADLDAKMKELAQLRPFKDKYAEDENIISGLRKDLAGSKEMIEGLQGEKKKAEAEVQKVRAEAEARFAGVALAGRRVVFLVDKSGSMKYVGEGEDQKSPEKWVEVRNSVAKIMRSLPQLEKYQVIAFSNKTEYVLGDAGKWIDYDPKASPDRVLKALAAVEPEGGTDMHAAFDLAFKFKANDLDTIYLLSDGLPNLGEGLKPGDDKKSEDEQGVILGNYIRNKLKTTWNKPGDKARVHINSVGFFYESPNVGAFLWAMSRENDGGFVGMSKP
jgi:predicted  nucleic acid-binding Zn-ribbon protein